MESLSALPALLTSPIFNTALVSLTELLPSQVRLSCYQEICSRGTYARD